MGVSGAGKSSVAARLAERLGYTFGEADDFHPPRNVAKLANAVPLTDADRGPWLDALARWLREQHAAGRSTVLACSALKRGYRDRLRAAAPHLCFVHLVAAHATLRERMTDREHYMPVELLASQLQDLERLEPDEAGIELDAASSIDALVAEAATRLASSGGRH